MTTTFEHSVEFTPEIGTYNYSFPDGFQSGAALVEPGDLLILGTTFHAYTAVFASSDPPWYDPDTAGWNQLAKVHGRFTDIDNRWWAGLQTWWKYATEDDPGYAEGTTPESGVTQSFFGLVFRESTKPRPVFTAGPNVDEYGPAGTSQPFEMPAYGTSRFSLCCTLTHQQGSDADIDEDLEDWTRATVFTDSLNGAGLYFKAMAAPGETLTISRQGYRAISFALAARRAGHHIGLVRSGSRG